ncbi:origin recognition complex subunit 4 [Exophiala xenobiotica]|uniref:Origin recognition complex subunit 4 n=1 Tax=Vermiconidia calcicola TaxID=1690605 RepID=A0AAV9QMB1_9PEZI|nr:origin recognition complex subunit 4 [Exophiala xenobiotica]KAK5543808.1 origin recognition complex subunit 4 [Vermiconidia calcicola]KAK5548486.1 origin recognition complex subunit 4 [Chaetothyriales sp. CCFEE 6169]KAK5197277.1 origin recognition complex subunit 4 [Exophiala xenobiotica]KAK5307391.1 origin recognition complex subunit 4 [Exophiala xenobiotica]
MEDFDPSPRASKRRRTGTYATRRTTLDTLDSTVPADQSSNKDTTADEEYKSAGNGAEHAEDSTEQATDTLETKETTSRRSSTRIRKPSARVAEAEQDVTPIAAQKLKRKDLGTGKGSAGLGATKLASKEDAARGGQDDQEDPEPQTRSSGRTRKVPRRFSPEVNPQDHGQVGKKPAQKTAEKIKPHKPTGEDLASAAQSPRPKGILTPSRHARDKRNGPRKSVLFDANERKIEENLGFKDIDSSSTPKNTKNSRRAPKNAVSKQGETSTHQKDVATGREPLLGDVDDGDDDEPDLETAPNVDEILSLTTNTLPHVNGDKQPPSYEPEDEHIAKIKTEILGRMTNRTISPISHLRSQYSTLHSLLSATIAAGESNSLLLLGSRGSGKSLLISHALSDLTRSYGDDFHVVRLNGFFQTDDKVALREIWRQLGREMAVSEDETGEVSSYADTMASLLSLLSHPEELAEPDADAMLLDNPTNRTAKSVIFIMDEFDLFTTHPRQTLLYNLFDIAQAKKAPIAVIGCSTRMDVVDCLEKRVKSRFSHRWLHVPSAKAFPAFEETIASILLMPVDGKEILGVGKNEVEWNEKWNRVVKTQLLPSPTVQALVKKIFHSTKSIPDVLAALYTPIAELFISSDSDNDQQKAAPATLTMSLSSMSAPSLLGLLPQLPTLHLSLLIAAARLETIHNFMAVNVALVYSHYIELHTRAKLQRSSMSSLTKGGALTGAGLRQWSKTTAKGAWEELAQWEAIVPASGVGVGASGKVNDEWLSGDGVGMRMFKVDVTLDEMAWAVKEKLGSTGAGELLTKWCNNV